MFWWRKRSEGFEWRDYVRTTILVRREERRQRIKDVKGAAASHVKEAGRRGVDAAVAGGRAAATGSWWSLKAAGTALKGAAGWAWHAAGRAAVVLASLAVAGTTALAAGVARAATGLASLTRGATSPLAPIFEPILSFARRPKPNLALKVVAVLAGAGAAYRAWAFGFDGDAKVAAALAAIAGLLVVLAALTDPDRRWSTGAGRLIEWLGDLRHYDVNLPGDRHLSVGAAALSVLALVGITAAGLAVVGQFGATSASDTRVAAAPAAGTDASTTTATATTTSARNGSDPAAMLTSRRAQAVTGDTLKIGSALIVLDGIEAPETGQSCERASGRWRCGTAARDALARLIRGRSVSCEITGELESGAKRGTCATGDTDLAEKLLEDGMVFAASGFFLNRYARIERKARSEKNGLWAGEAERPEEWRARRWAEAKEKAPDGCPIKGRIRSGARTYLLPWSPAYDRVRLSRARGERWFCSESEAEAAGWRRASPS